MPNPLAYAGRIGQDVIESLKIAEIQEKKDRKDNKYRLDSK
jgi:hypothetical protein